MTTTALEARESFLVIENTQVYDDLKLERRAEACLETTLKAIRKPSHYRVRCLAGDVLTPICPAEETIQPCNGCACASQPLSPHCKLPTVFGG
jgi:hypothetical protein